MSLVRSPSQVSMGGADELPHYTGSLQIPQSLQQPSPAPSAPYTPTNAPSQKRVVLCPDAPVAAHGGYILDSTMSSAVSTSVHPHESPATGNITPNPMFVLHNWQGMQGSPTPSSVIGTPINAASTFWRTQVCPHAPLQRNKINPLDSSNGSSAQTPINKWPSNISTPMIVSSPSSRGPDPDALRFAICGAKLDLAGASTLVDAFEKDVEVFGQSPDEDTNKNPVMKETNIVPVEAVVSRKPNCQLWKRHTEKPRFSTRLKSVPEMSDMTSPDWSPPIDITEYESPEKVAAPVRMHARDAQKPRKKDQSRFITN